MRIKVNERGFPLRGADEDGRCYFVKNTYGDDSQVLDDDIFDWANILADTVDEPLYYDDSVLSFHKSQIYGCRLDLDFDELQEFCDAGLWNHMMLFQNLLQLELVGISGNSDPHYSEDWLQITIDETLDRFEDLSAGANDGFLNKDYCVFPSVRIVEIFFEKINTK